VGGASGRLRWAGLAVLAVLLTPGWTAPAPGETGTAGVLPRATAALGEASAAGILTRSTAAPGQAGAAGILLRSTAPGHWQTGTAEVMPTRVFFGWRVFRRYTFVDQVVVWNAPVPSAVNLFLKGQQVAYIVPRSGVVDLTEEFRGKTVFGQRRSHLKPGKGFVVDTQKSRDGASVWKSFATGRCGGRRRSSAGAASSTPGPRW
jgi:hypothetical protein